eukprot:CAMPEP_0170551252 /NCGR_PEP_ID=MMETSP0211-20121228/9292_1 /TAXON_ID=311385 /ORGANISM="Pseudokeronopsis sp., Strain OXSARD2" /LENGTH=72 /DNA_ID=CAMNT_0010858327 /DNA_START=504 /DNA_END=722 /DNA_ORIENTATION=-
MVLFHYDGRFYTWWGDYSLDGWNWEPFAAGKHSKGTEIFSLGKDVKAQYLRFKGTNNLNTFLHLLKLELDYV